MSGLIRKASFRSSLRKSRPRRISFRQEVYVQDAIMDGKIAELKTIFAKAAKASGDQPASPTRSACDDGEACHVNMELTGGKTPLHLAVDYGRLNLVQFFVNDCGANVNIVDNSGWTPLHRAVGNGNTEIARYLLDNGADAFGRTPDGSLPLSLAMDRGDPDMVKVLSFTCGKRGSKSDKDFYTTLAALTERRKTRENVKPTVSPTSPTAPQAKAPQPLRRVATAPSNLPRIAVCVWPGGEKPERSSNHETDSRDPTEEDLSAFQAESASSVPNHAGAKRRAASDSKTLERQSSHSCPGTPSDNPQEDGGSRVVIDYFKRQTAQRRSFRQAFASLTGRSKQTSNVWKTVSPAATPRRSRSPRTVF